MKSKKKKETPETVSKLQGEAEKFMSDKKGIVILKTENGFATTVNGLSGDEIVYLLEKVKLNFFLDK